MPELTEVEVRPALRGPDDNRAALPLKMGLVVARLFDDLLRRRLELGLAHRRDAR
jgi:hypothetical protein